VLVANLYVLYFRGIDEEKPSARIAKGSGAPVAPFAVVDEFA